MRWGPGDLAFAGSLFYSTYEDLIDAVLVGRSHFVLVSNPKKPQQLPFRHIRRYRSKNHEQ
jgi:hypothetical protein